ncbi:ArsC/Spx/MgsR family protein [Clostridium sp. BJN0001]|uniref:arsenate reductase family protein n=1 Tax=Clostridium sp. BJN0001 TaxID=2930219 RepID=UPI001FD548B0|nr:ArsC/Spx/MgsR family protein [Clostridium sp. BJN0001]
MSIQIFGTKKCFDTKKAQRFFKERRVKFQFIDLKEKEMSKGEFLSVVKSCGINDLINDKAKDYKKSNLDKIRSAETKMEIVFKNQLLLKTPIVRSGPKAAAGFDEDKWTKLIE